MTETGMTNLEVNALISPGPRRTAPAHATSDTAFRGAAFAHHDHDLTPGRVYPPGPTAAVPADGGPERPTPARAPPARPSAPASRPPISRVSRHST